ncbi:calmodulin [Gregarina niphandrodes]|uniref:Calmodulin n=1 Tax=Gregarina niphandrodes TaxID=110365 RepID=A0A023B274_GRENI|nr:calmodulin [Gregarina niphandrodes]EZG51568.1 calmodulin [Gregarina niphandrodes]|eukprot:XP_011131952.1 calmodulin [Gregarina niphandrodes]
MDIEDYRAAFSLFDINGDGHISPSELGAVMRSMGLYPSEGDIQQMIAGLPNKEIAFNDFVGLVTKNVAGTSLQDELEEAYQMFDRDGNGLISASELQHVLKHLGEDLNDDEIAELICGVDGDNDAQVNYSEFINLMTSSNRPATAASGDDW